MLYFTMLCVVWQGILSLSPLIYAKQDSRARERQAARAKRNAAAHHDRHEEIGLPVKNLKKGWRSSSFPCFMNRSAVRRRPCLFCDAEFKITYAAAVSQGLGSAPKESSVHVPVADVIRVTKPFHKLRTAVAHTAVLVRTFHHIKAHPGFR